MHIFDDSDRQRFQDRNSRIVAAGALNSLRQRGRQFVDCLPKRIPEKIRETAQPLPAID